MRTINVPASRERRRRRLELAKGSGGVCGKQFRQATEAVDRGQAMTTIHRKLRKRDFRHLWIARINAATRAEGMTSSRFMKGLTKAGIETNRMMLPEMPIADPEGSRQLIEKARNTSP